MDLAGNTGETDEAPAVRAELEKLNSELSEVTVTLQRRRRAFAEQVAEHDAERAELGLRVQEAFDELQAERGCMEAMHCELAGERQIIEELEAECSSLEDLYSGHLRDSVQESAAKDVESDDGAEDEELVASAHGRLEAAVVQREVLHAELFHAELAANTRAVPAEQTSSMEDADIARELLLHAAMGDLSDTGRRLAEAVTAGVESRLGRLDSRIQGAASTLRVHSAGLAQCDAVHVHAWDLELEGLLEALSEAEGLAGQLLAQQPQCSTSTANDCRAGELAEEMAVLRCTAAHELRAGLARALPRRDAR